ncbi:MAG: MBL fold metallo-hydrolase [Betaproteobacteria bacterium]
MIFQRINSEGLAASSYLIGSGREAAVIDPRRDVDVYLCEAREHCMEIKYVLETHRHEDFALGSLTLKAATGASICRGDNTQVTYADRRLKDCDTLAIGGLMIKVLETPGHTTDSLSYVLYESDRSEVPLMVFSGDALFAGSCGRVDLNGESRRPECAASLYRSLHEKLLPLGDHTLLWPAHGAGSVCGKGISDRDWTTMGYERRTNPWLSIDRETFIRKKSEEQPLYPPYFRRMERWNEAGAPPMPAAGGPKPVDADAFSKAIAGQDVALVDTRMPTAFAGGHIPGSLNLFLEGMSVFPGWLVDLEKPVWLLTERPEDAQTAALYLARIGFDRVEGYLCGGFEKWQNRGLPIGHVGALSVDALKLMLDAGMIRLIDVREPDEWADGIIPGAELIFLGDLKGRLPAGPKDSPIAVTCSVGRRGSMGASILRQAGFTNVYNVLGGTTAWMNRGFPLAEDRP